jgi:dehydrodolichyl diphosphate syntase complex subunit NUS1
MSTEDGKADIVRAAQDFSQLVAQQLQKSVDLGVRYIKQFISFKCFS